MEIKDGYYNGVIQSADIIKSRYAKENENRLEVELTCIAKSDGGEDIASGILLYLELSSEYPKFGDTTKPFWRQTMDRLHSMGFKGEDLSTINTQMTGKPCRLNYRTKDKNGQPVKNPGWYLSSERERVAVSGASANAALAQMMSLSGAASAAPSAEPDDNPFA